MTFEEQTKTEALGSQYDARPLVTFALFAYNQERFVRKAIEGAFSQTYQPLEIILSDDCSTDMTFDIMKELVSMYCGPHKVILRRNDINVGLARHVNIIAKCASAKLLIISSGDDISKPERSKNHVKTWMLNNCSTILMHSDFSVIDEFGNEKNVDNGDFYHDCKYIDIIEICKYNKSVLGASSSFTTNLLLEFPELIPELVHEDCCLPFRSRLFGAPVVFIAERLILYRKNIGGLSDGYGNIASMSAANKLFRRFYIDYMQKKIDCEHIGRFDLLPIIASKLKDYRYGSSVTDPNTSLFDLLSEFIVVRPSLILACLRIIKYRVIYPLFIDKWIKKGR